MSTHSTHIKPRGTGCTLLFLASAAVVATVAVNRPSGFAVEAIAATRSTSTTTPNAHDGAARKPSQASGSAPAGSLSLVTATRSTRNRSWTYGWPLEPFDSQHPIRAFLDDPRIGHEGGVSFHFGVDISAPDGTAVYAVEGGTVHVQSRRAIAVVAPDGSHRFGYWHIVPSVRNHQQVVRHQLLGHIAAGWEHVHFAERRGGVYVNPLRDGGLGPYYDRTPPTVDAISLAGFALVVTAHDTPDPRVPGAWANEPVTPALIRWRVDGGNWQTAVDFRAAMLPRTAFRSVYTPETRQNLKGKPGDFSFYLVRHWSLAGTHRVDVEVSDTVGNRSVASGLVRTAR
jgi:murein DD-endopeptidase MepM/ murein hydrolase activator NlpD